MVPSAGSPPADHPTSPAQGAQGAQAVQGDPVDGDAAAERRTPAGLPWRVRQASLPKQLTDGTDSQPATGVPTVRDPEQVRMMMRSYQHGTQRGRTDGSAGNRPIAGSRPDDSHRTSPERPADPEG